MISFLVFLATVFLAVILQITFLGFFSVGSIGIEITPLFVIYAGFRFDAVYAGLFSFLLGFFVDSLISPVAGLYILIYVLLFYLSFLAAAKINSDNTTPLSLFTGACFLLQGVLIALFYWLILDETIIESLFTVFIPQAVLMVVFSPFVYGFLRRIEGLFYAENRQPDRRL
jgi:rod shape-determining protein MreD